VLEATDYRLRQRDYLLRIGQAITAQLDLSAVLSLVIEYAVEIVAGTYGFIALHGERLQRLRIVASYNLPQLSWSAFDPLLEVLLLPSATVEDEAATARSVAEALGLPLRQAVSLPLLIGGTTIGVIVVFRAAVNVAFTADDRRMLQSFADQAAIAVQNARLYQSAVRERERLHAIIEESADGVMIFDERWRITTFNRAMERLTGWSRDEAIGRPCAEVLAYQNPQGQNLCLVDCPLQRRPPAEHPVAEGWIETPDGRRRYLESRYSPTRGPQGEFLGAIANVRDITAQKQEEEQQLTFVSVISHELKTPVAIIKGYAGTLRRPDATWDQATTVEGLTIIEEEADRLNDLIANLLDVSRLQAGSLPLTLAPFSLPELTARVVQGIAATAGDGFSFQLRFPGSFPLVLGDENRIRMVLGNLLTNAVKYSPNGGAIRVGGWVEGTYALVYVSDQGIGIAAQDRERIFERFYRADNTLSREAQGAGLGLYLARVIVEAHGGRIYAEGQPQGGSRFVFTLPLDRPQLRVTGAHAGVDQSAEDPVDRADAQIPAEVSAEMRAEPERMRYTEEDNRAGEAGTGS
jgi:PAS domain S-box-containing protein